jgi:hypothetical protein
VREIRMLRSKWRGLETNFGFPASPPSSYDAQAESLKGSAIILALSAPWVG